MAWDYKWEPTKLQSEVSLLGVDALLGILSQLRLQMLLMRNFPAIFKSGCRLSAQFGNVYAFASIYCFYLFSFNDYILKWNQIIFYRKLKLFNSVQLFSHVWLCTPWTAARQVSLSITNSQSLLKLLSIQSLMRPNHLILCRPLLLPSILLSIRVFSNESVLRIRWPNYWSFSFNISSSSEYSGLISFRMDWLGLFAV